MTPAPSKKELIERIHRLEDAVLQKERYEKINHALFRIANAVNTTETLKTLYVDIHSALSGIIDTTNFFIALYERESDSVVFPYCIDEIDGQLPPVSGISKTASLTAQVIRSGRPLLLNKEEIIALRQKKGISVPDCTPSQIWLGVPLRHESGIIGVIAVQSYTQPGLYDDTDVAVMLAVADQVALAIEKKRFQENQLKLIDQLHTTLEEVRTLRGILPICSRCKKIRDDKGYWNRIETYIQKHSQAHFSHGICPACADALYGKEEWYDEVREDITKNSS